MRRSFEPRWCDGTVIKIGIDLGGTKIEVIALDEGGREILRRRVETPQGDYHGTLRMIARLVEEAVEREV